ncbi:hypothetical protein QKW52_19250 [Bacillus sonorensis]|nr:hypothetical protein [Bacillus sonorensis]
MNKNQLWSDAMYSFDYMYWYIIKHLLQRDFELVQALSFVRRSLA